MIRMIKSAGAAVPAPTLVVRLVRGCHVQILIWGRIGIVTEADWVVVGCVLVGREDGDRLVVLRVWVMALAASGLPDDRLRL